MRRVMQAPRCGWLAIACLTGQLAQAQQPPPPQATPQSLRHAQPMSPPLEATISHFVNFGLNATVTSPTTVALGWNSISGATSFTVVRDHVPIMDVPFTARAFTDSTIKPLVSYSYQLRANGLHSAASGALSALPVDSPQVVVVAPLPLPPSGLTASVMGAGNVQLSWTSRPEAAAYQLNRNGIVFRIAANVPAAFADNNPGTADAQYTIQTIVRASDGSEFKGYPGPILAVRVRPFNLIVAGDSIMWGQGLTDATKFSTKVIQWLGVQLGGRSIQPFNHAHSGAIVGSSIDDWDKPSNSTHLGGEVPESYPSVLNQTLGLARADLNHRQIPPGDVDMILMDGCANDIGLTKVLNPFTNNSDIATDAVTYCYNETGSNLKAIHGIYPNAKIIVTGYYPIVSKLSDPLAVTTLTTVILGPLGLVGGVAAWQQAIDHSGVFAATANSMLMNAVLVSNGQIGANVIRLVVPPFNETNAYAAPATYVWLVPSPPTPPNLFDEVFWPRQSTCRNMGASMPISCPPASMGHPNDYGAQAYANAITTALGEFTPQWKMQFSMMQRGP